MSKEQIISLEDALEEGIVKIGDYIDYKPTYGEYCPNINLTAHKHNPTFKTENFGWKLDKVDEKMLLVADGVTKELLRLYGKIGYDHGIEALNNIARVCYTDPMLADEAIGMTGHVYKSLALCNVLRGLPDYWLGSRYATNYALFDAFGLCAINSDFMGGDYLFYSYGYEGSNSSCVRPVVFLKSNIQIVLSEESNGTKKNPWKTLRAKTNSTAETATQNKEETESVVKKELTKEADSAKREKETLQDLLQQSEKIAVESMESLRQLNEMIQTIKEILNS